MIRIGKPLALTAVLLGLSSASHAVVIEVTLGNDTAFADGETPTVVEVGLAQGGEPAPFDTSYGADISLFGSGVDFSAMWTFIFASPVDPVLSTELSIGIYDHDSAAAGDQVLSYIVDGVDLTADLNAAFEANGGAVNEQYNVYTISLDPSTFASLDDGMVDVLLTLQGPGLLPPPLFGPPSPDPSNNGANLLFSTLSITTQDVVAVPEPTSLSLFALGLGALGWSRRRRAVPES